ncbi:MAG: cation transporter, partial [Candidatus Peregrinibacteria bacterium]
MPPTRITLSITGMHCASCALLITQALKKTPGVQDATVNFAAEKASVLFDPSAVSVQALIQTVSLVGYKAETFDAADKDFEERKRA